jgi:regulatory protein
MDKKQAIARAMALCSRKEYCEAGIRSKLAFWDVDPDDHNEIIALLKKEKFLDDSRYALAFVRDKIRINHWGRVKVRYMLSMERVSHAIIDEALAEIDEETYHDILEELLRKKSIDLKKETDPRIRREKLIRFAQSRGFEMDQIIKLLK